MQSGHHHPTALFLSGFFEEGGLVDSCSQFQLPLVLALESDGFDIEREGISCKDDAAELVGSIEGPLLIVYAGRCSRFGENSVSISPMRDEFDLLLIPAEAGRADHCPHTSFIIEDCRGWWQKQPGSLEAPRPTQSVLDFKTAALNPSQQFTLCSPSSAGMSWGSSFSHCLSDVMLNTDSMSIRELSENLAGYLEHFCGLRGIAQVPGCTLNGIPVKPRKFDTRVPWRSTAELWMSSADLHCMTSRIMTVEAMFFSPKGIKGGST